TVGVCGTSSSPVMTFFPLLAVLQCPSPPKIRNGQHESKDVKTFFPGTSVKYYCDQGYILTGKTTVSCLVSGTWSIPYPRCDVLPCPPPPIIANATYSGEIGANFTSGMSVNYSCQPGFTLLGEPSVQCTASGNWSLPYPRCEGGA
ncbi:C4BPA protein, partial [Alcedo cyanopectus]|nr:C4BPA protein [Ceyx cyanopectus]